jgi:serine/threonine protein kinase
MNRTMFKLRPTKLKKFESAKFTRYLGNGTFSNVMLYQLGENNNNDDHTCVVVKQLKFKNKLYRNKERMRKYYDNLIQILYHEYEIGCSLNHKNIIKTLDIDETNGCIILENFVGIDLLDLLNENDVPSGSKLLKYFKQTIDGVQFMHSNGVAHMYIKLENVLLKRETEDVKLIDFGCAIEFIHETCYKPLTTLCGTKSYFPPEYFTNSNFYPDKVDMWCCGIILYNLVYDKMPWDYACELKDKTFFIYKNKCKAEMPNVLFPDLTLHGFNVDDSRIIYQLLTGLLEINPTERFDVNTTKKLLSQIKH